MGTALQSLAVGARGLLAALAVLASVGVLAGCGSSKSSSSSSGASTSGGASATTSMTTASGSGGAAAQIRRDWMNFFSGSTSAQTKISLLQNGQQFSQAIKAQAGSPLAQQASAKVTKVTVTGPDKAQVKYSVLIAGKPALPNQTGTAIKSGGTWKVSDASFCALLRLEGGAPPACPKG